MTVTFRLGAILIAILIVFSGASAVTFFNLGSQTNRLSAASEEAAAVGDRAIPLLSSIKEIKIDVIQVQQWISDISATRGQDGLNDGLDVAAQFAGKFAEDVKKARALAGSMNHADVVTALDAATKAFDPYYQTGIKMAKIYIEQGPAGGNKMMPSFDAVASEIGKSMDSLTSLVEKATDARLAALAGANKALETGNAQIIRINLILAGVGFLIALGGALYLYRLIKGSIDALLDDITKISDKNYGAGLSLSTARKDEFGRVAKILHTAMERLAQADQAEIDRQDVERKNLEARRRQRNDLAESFQSSVGHVVEAVSSAATELQASAKSMSATAEQTSSRSGAVTSAAEEASSNVQTVASAAEELSSSISEISRQVSQSTQIAGTAVAEVDGTNAKIQGLAEAANKIGEVVALITDIADQTNLLALNATIEAARAGEAGKGFAVVASEVKNLANQTAKATEEIGAQIGGIQGATREAVEAMGSIGKVIGEMNEIASAIAAAVEEQGAATQEIARNVEQASDGTSRVSTNIMEVTQAATETGQSSAEILSAATELSRQSESLRGEVQRFIVQIRED
ncbi:methyl-accepting chemotaxis protein [Varunaivibrio sulfuroxidans]|uniref:Methyl-accepting chemotaxis sensory transducer n=1 Tax=Varunaivibrio sulfuroxidans TaxID=1773489 RepID=A0A4R3JGG3_9PROT|nr:methyl-accepting chemotaxis protein [Varunaivibrio sulfuroxidans]TCS64977.1 methyl-accepting chemotaxis sensory transducer [Varunaivibrio sulfuroxidans]WES29732.1 methyl-accepting chemotaxis protein [Varunaivibrio sulfuroxidans]